jgi:hypothetical protein
MLVTERQKDRFWLSGARGPEYQNFDGIFGANEYLFFRISKCICLIEK